MRNFFTMLKFVSGNWVVIYTMSATWRTQQANQVSHIMCKLLLLSNKRAIRLSVAHKQYRKFYIFKIGWTHVRYKHSTDRGPLKYGA